MNVTGVIVEYNPFHNGHLYHLEQSKNLANSDYIVAVMSGNFVQRGEPAILDKWSRAEMALRAGVDLVLELPFIYSTSSAEGFAFGAVSLLNSLGIVNNICFGSESGDIASLKIISEILANEPREYKEFLQFHLKSGLSFPSAREKALINYIENQESLKNIAQEIKDILSNSNNILGIEYLKSLIKLKSSIKPWTIIRKSNSYNQKNMSGAISSATAIRSNFSDINLIQEAVPDYTLEILNREVNLGKGPINIEKFSQTILYKIRSSSTEYIKNLLDVSEGLEYRIKQAAEESSNIDELISRIKNKRYTSTRIQRILLYSIFGITKDYQEQIKNPAEYARILGFTQRGRALLRSLKESSSIPIITNPSLKDLNLLKTDVLATDIYSLAIANPNFKKAKQDLIKSPVII